MGNLTFPVQGSRWLSRALQKQKHALMADVLGEEKFAQSLTLDDLRFLFAD